MASCRLHPASKQPGPQRPGCLLSHLGELYHFIGVALTWEGHEFLDAARSDTVWVKATSTIGQQVGSAGIEVLKALLQATIKGMIGLA